METEKKRTVGTLIIVSWAMGIMAAYAVEFSLPLAVIVLGVSFGKAAIKAKNAEAAIRIIAGVLLLVAGFYFLATI